MTFHVEIAGRTRTVLIEPMGAGMAGGRFRVTVTLADTGSSSAPEIRELDVRQTDLGLSMVYIDDGRSVDAALSEQPGGCLVQLPHADLVATLQGRSTGLGGSRPRAADGEVRLTAQMPGRVLRVLVRPGDDVAAGQGLVVIEAMKMENEIPAPRAGRVREVAVAEGTPVSAGQPLLVLD